MPYNAPFLTPLHCFKDSEYSWKIWIPSELLGEKNTDIQDSYRIATYTNLNERYNVKIFSNKDNKTMLADLVLRDPKFHQSEQDLPQDIRKSQVFWNLFEYEITEIKRSVNTTINLKNSKVWVMI